MPKCPKCGENIDHLDAYSYEQNRRAVSVVEGAGGDFLDWYNNEPVDLSCTKDEFQCPKCKAILFTTNGNDTNPQTVIDFLKGKTEPVRNVYPCGER